VFYCIPSCCSKRAGVQLQAWQNDWLEKAPYGEKRGCEGIQHLKNVSAPASIIELVSCVKWRRRGIRKGSRARRAVGEG
jgi:hypothetical protein